MGEGRRSPAERGGETALCGAEAAVSQSALCGRSIAGPLCGEDCVAVPQVTEGDGLVAVDGLTGCLERAPVQLGHQRDSTALLIRLHDEASMYRPCEASQTLLAALAALCSDSEHACQLWVDGCDRGWDWLNPVRFQSSHFRMTEPGLEDRVGLVERICRSAVSLLRCLLCQPCLKHLR